jgi:hypothetical protein
VTTQAHSAPAGQHQALLRRHAAAPGSPTPQHVDEAAPRDGVFTLVVVHLDGATHLAPPVLALRTTFTFHDRTPISRTWIARGNTREVRALFGLPTPPRSATTTLGQ